MTNSTALRTAAENLLSVGACVAAPSGDATPYAGIAHYLALVAHHIDKGASAAGAVRAAAEVPVQAPTLDLPPDLVPWDVLSVTALVATAGALVEVVRLAPAGEFTRLTRSVMDDLDDLRRRLAAGASVRTAVSQHVLAVRLRESLPAVVAA